MRYGAGLSTSKPIQDVVEEAKRLAADGFSCLSSSHIFGYDAITLLGVVGLAVPDVELMTAVVPTYTRHPIAMAQQALTVQAATDGRFVLGIGLSHQVLVEAVYGLSFDQPLRAMREYLAVLMPLLQGERVHFTGETLRVNAGPLEIPTVAPVVIVAALGTASAERAGRPDPRVMAALPVCVTNEVEAARSRADEVFAMYGTLPSYRAMLDREGAAGPGEAAIVGDEDAVRSVLAELEAAGVTDFSAAPIGSREEISRTRALFRECRP
jgi:alkanesulfonate monooxygenase SsuD/methylene tetrahydromethanopterin reductase-like flavin-dependent oxidoreductase (luciferase family)